jgi:hypothetical protein
MVDDVTDPLPPTTTYEENLVTAGQRRVNLIWEFTQATVTVMITAAAIFCAIKSIEAQVINFAFVAIVSTYYARTNHTKTGGVLPNQSGR